MKVTASGLEKIQKTQNELADLGFSSVWQKVVERMFHDDYYDYLVNLKTGQVILLNARSGDFHTQDRVTLYNLEMTTLEQLKYVRTPPNDAEAAKTEKPAEIETIKRETAFLAITAELYGWKMDEWHKRLFEAMQTEGHLRIFMTRGDLKK